MEKCVSCGKETKHSIPYYTAECDEGEAIATYFNIEEHTGAYCSKCAYAKAYGGLAGWIGSIFLIIMGAAFVVIYFVSLLSSEPAANVWISLLIGTPCLIGGAVTVIKVKTGRKNDTLPKNREFERDMVAILRFRHSKNPTSHKELTFRTRAEYEELMKEGFTLPR